MVKKLFDINNPTMQFLLKAFDLMYLQFLTIIFCIPLVTIGAAITAMHRVCFRLYRDEAQGITYEFFTGFKANFKSATPLWLFYFTTLVFLLINNYIVYFVNFSPRNPLTYFLPFLDLIFVFSLSWLFVIAFRYNNSFFQTIVLSFKFSVLAPLRTMIMILIAVLPLVCIVIYPKIVPVCSLLGLTFPAYVFAAVYSPILNKVEQMSNLNTP